MPTKRWKTWLCWGLYLAVATGLGFAIDATLPAQPNLLLRSDGANGFGAGVVSADGKILTTGTFIPEPDADASRWYVTALETWDTHTARRRHAFFRGLVGADQVFDFDSTVRKPTDPDASGFVMRNVQYSPDRRYCALLHGEGMALADLQTGREWPLAVKIKIEEFASWESAWIYRRLHRPMEAKKLREKLKMRKLLEHLREELGVSVFVDSGAMAEATGAAFPNQSRYEVGLSAGPARMDVQEVLRLLLPVRFRAVADFAVSRESINVTTAKKVREREVAAPVFSPRGSFVALAEASKGQGKLHVVESATGHIIAAFSTHPAGFGIVGFTPDEEMMYFFASEDAEPLFTVWDTREKRVVRTLKNVGAQRVDGAPDGKTLATINEDGVLELLDVRTGARRRLLHMGNNYSQLMFTPDSRTLLRRHSGDLELWDVETGKLRATLEAGWRPYGCGMFIAGDSNVIGTFGPGRPRFRTWDLETRNRLWCVTDEIDPARNLVKPWPLIIDNPSLMPGDQWPRSFERLGMQTDQDEQTPRTTPDGRFLVGAKVNHIDMLDPVTGASVVRHLLGGRTTKPRVIGFTPDSRWMVSYWDNPARMPWKVEEWLGPWWPAPEATTSLVVSEVATGRVQFRTELRDHWLCALSLSDNGKTLMACWYEDRHEVVACWSVSPWPSLWCVVGIPLGLVGVGVLLRWRLTRKRGVQPGSAVE